MSTRGFKIFILAALTLTMAVSFQNCGKFVANTGSALVPNGPGLGLSNPNSPDNPNGSGEASLTIAKKWISPESSEDFIDLSQTKLGEPFEVILGLTYDDGSPPFTCTCGAVVNGTMSKGVISVEACTSPTGEDNDACPLFDFDRNFSVEQDKMLKLCEVEDPTVCEKFK